MRGFIGQIQSVGMLGHWIVDKNNMRRIGGREIAYGWKHRILARAAQRIARHGPCTALLDMVAIGERLGGFILDCRGVGRPLNRSRGLPKSARPDRDRARTDILRPQPWTLLRECAG